MRNIQMDSQFSLKGDMNKMTFRKRLLKSSNEKGGN